MNKLSKSTWLLIGLVIVLTALGTTLLVTMPEEYSFRFYRFGEFKEGLPDNEDFTEHHRYIHRAKPFGSKIFIILIIAGVIFIAVGIHKKKMFHMSHMKRDISLEILKEEYAEGRISKEELIRKRKIIEE